MTDSFQGRTVALPDGTVGEVVAEWRGHHDEYGVHEGHRLRIRIKAAVCPSCPHGSQDVMHFRTADAGDVRVL